MVKEVILVFESKTEIHSIVSQSSLKDSYKIVVSCGAQSIQPTISSYHISLIFVDLEHPTINLIEEYFQMNHPSIPIIFVSSLFGYTYYTAKNPANPNQLVEDINLEGLLFKISPRSKKVAHDFLQETWKLSTLLTPQEKRILRLLEQGYTNKEIAHTLGLMVTTVKTYNYILYQKLSVKNRTQAIMAAKKEGII